jgi:hypothetical protein
MIHDAEVEVTCDGKDCRGRVYVGLRAGARDTYIADDSAIERSVAREHDWVVRDGKHYCSEECAPDTALR